MRSGGERPVEVPQELQEFLVPMTAVALADDLERQKADEAGRTLRRNSKLRSRIESSRTERTVAGTKTAVFAPEMDRVKRVVVKNARGHALYELDRPMPSEPDVFCGPFREPDTRGTS